MARRRIPPIATVLLLSLACAGFSTLRQAGVTSGLTRPGGSTTPAEAVRRGVCRSGAPPEEFEAFETYERVLRRGGTPDRLAVVVYRARCPQGSPLGSLGEFGSFEQVHRSWFSWGDAGAPGPLPVWSDIYEPPARFVTAEGGGSGEMAATGRFEAVSGHVLQPERVAMVEVVLGGGRVVRRRVGGEVGAYSIFAPRAVLCELRVLGAGGELLERRDLSEGRERCRRGA